MELSEYLALALKNEADIESVLLSLRTLNSFRILLGERIETLTGLQLWSSNTGGNVVWKWRDQPGKRLSRDYPTAMDAYRAMLLQSIEWQE